MSNNKIIPKRLTHRQRVLERDEHTFGTPIDQSLNQDFDFEKNLALFNKEVRPYRFVFSLSYHHNISSTQLLSPVGCMARNQLIEARYRSTVGKQ